MSLLDGDTFSATMLLVGFEVVVHRDGDNVFAGLAEYEQLITNGRKYEFDKSEGIAYYEPAGVYEFEEALSAVSAFDAMIVFDGAQLTDTGIARFPFEEGFKDTFYEEITEKSGEVKRVFFDEDDVLVGFEMTGMDGVMSKTKFRVSGEIPEGVFDIPEGFEEKKR